MCSFIESTAAVVANMATNTNATTHNNNSHSHNTHTTTNSHNKTFNLQFFLNEECKDAMNMSEFIQTIKVKLSDLENVGKAGYVEGISKIIINQLNDTDVYKRPVHCSDAKRETLYIKEENKWEKESPENTTMKNLVKTVEKKNMEMISNWRNVHPDFNESCSSSNDDYLKVVLASVGGHEEHVSKVIKKVSREIIIEK